MCRYESLFFWNNHNETIGKIVNLVIFTQYFLKDDIIFTKGRCAASIT